VAKPGAAALVCGVLLWRDGRGASVDAALVAGPRRGLCACAAWAHRAAPAPVAAWRRQGGLQGEALVGQGQGATHHGHQACLPESEAGCGARGCDGANKSAAAEEEEEEEEDDDDDEEDIFYMLNITHL
jgi:hypothetical protein